MRKTVKQPRIIKIEKVGDMTIRCMFNNGESRKLDFNKIFELWDLQEGDIEYPLLDPREFVKVHLRNNTLSWSNIKIQLENEEGETETHPYEIDPAVLYELSEKINPDSKSGWGTLIRKARLKAGLTQQQLADKCGTTRFYISRLENNKSDIEMSTFRKIVEAGLEKKIKLTIE